MRLPRPCLRVFALVASIAAGCSEDTQHTYYLRIAAQTGENVFAGAERVVLELGSDKLDEATVRPGLPVTLSFDAVDPRVTKSGSFRVTALGPAPQNEVIAYGQTPDLEIARETQLLAVFVQKPGTFRQSTALAFGLKEHVAVAGSAPPLSGSNQTQTITLPVFGTGRELASTDATATQETLSNLVYVYDPLGHEVYEVGNTANDVAGMTLYRTGVAAWAKDDGSVLFFGGLAAVGASTDLHVTSQLDVFRIRRRLDFMFRKEAGVGFVDAQVARKDAVLAGSPGALVYAFGGSDDAAPLDSIVAIDSGAVAPARTLALLDTKMMAPRAGHTATLVARKDGHDILLFGGAPATGAVAEIFEPSAAANIAGIAGAPSKIFAVGGAPGPARRGHAAMVLPKEATNETRVLIIGGSDDQGAPLGDSVLYFADQRIAMPGPIALKTPRTGFAAFIIDDELVVAGGLDAARAPVDRAEIYNARDLTFVREEISLARARATATVLPNHSAVIIGGETQNARPTTVVEIYQPLRK